MKEISINQNSSTKKVKFGPIGRDIILNEKIEDETARAIAKETQLEEAIATAGAVKDVKCDGTSIVVSKVADIGPSINAKVLVETTRATEAETTLNTAILAKANDSAVVHNTGIETVNGTKIFTSDITVQESGNTHTAYYGPSVITHHIPELGSPKVINLPENDGTFALTSDITTAVATETTRATAAEGTLQTNIDNETNRAQGAETTLTTNLATEVTNRTNADTTLRNNITEEAQQREEADTVLFDSIEAEALARSIADANLQEQVNNLKARGRYLSLWNSTTGLPADNPAQLPYDYKAGDYYIIGTVGTGVTLYKPEGSQYTGTASTTEETREVSVNDVYYFDGINWAFQSNTQKEVSFSSLAGNPTDNTALATALNDKVSKSATSEQTITSPLNIGGHVLPTANNQYQLGSSSFRWNNIFGKSIYSDTYLVATGFVDSDLKPRYNDYYNLGRADGSNVNRWKNIYVSQKLDFKAKTDTPATTASWQLDSRSNGNFVVSCNNGDAYIFRQNDFIPYGSSVNRNLGVAGNYWNDLYLKGKIDLYNSTSAQTWGLTGSQYDGIFITRSSANIYTFNTDGIFPSSNGARSLGTPDYNWKNIYFKGELNANGSAGTSGQVLTSNGPDAPATWQAPTAPVPSNMVTTDTEQTITGVKTFSNGIKLGTKWELFENPSAANQIRFKYNNEDRFYFTSNTLAPANNGGFHLGFANARIGDIYLSGKISLTSSTNTNWNITTNYAQLVFKKGDNTRYTFTEDYASVVTIKPNINKFWDLGTTDFLWKDLYLSGKAYFNNSYITTDTLGSLTFVSDSGTIWSNSDIVSSNANGKLGTSDNQWASLYVKDINMTGVLSADGSQGTAGQVLTSNGPDAPATWQAPTAPVPSNMVTTDTEQTITGTKTFTSEDGISFGSNGYAWRVQYDLLCLKQTGGTGNAVQIGNSFVNLRDVKPILDNYFSLGNTTERWKDLYLSGKISLTSSTNTNWNITTNYAQLVFKNGDNTRYVFTQNYASVVTVKPSINNFWDLGTTDFLWKDLYMSGKIKDGTYDYSLIKEINTQDINLWNLDVGIYKLTYNGDKYLHYNGAYPTTKVAIGGDSEKLLYISKSWVGNVMWECADDIGNTRYGYSASNNGAYYQAYMYSPVNKINGSQNQITSGIYAPTTKGSSKQVVMSSGDNTPTFAYMNITLKDYSLDFSGSSITLDLSDYSQIGSVDDDDMIQIMPTNDSLDDWVENNVSFTISGSVITFTSDSNCSVKFNLLFTRATKAN